MRIEMLLVRLFMIFPLVAAACAVIMAARALVRGEVKTHSTRFPLRTITRAANPVEFWIEIGLYCVTAVVLTSLGLLFIGHAPHWLYEMVRNSKRH